MRFRVLLAAGLVWLATPACVAVAQDVGRYGQILRIGFENNYRNDAWTPLLVQVRSSELESKLYQLRVEQPDLDRDTAVYTRTISVDGTQPTQNFEMYFLPRPIDGGLPSRQQLVDWQRLLVVKLCDDRGREIGLLPMTTTASNVEDAINDERRGARFVVAVGDEAVPQFGEYALAVGTMEDVVAVKVRPTDLPENPVGYDAVDAVVWLNADAAELDEGGARRLAALEQYVLTGGRLVVCQPSQRERVAPLAKLLPVETVDPRVPGAWAMQVRERGELEPLRSLANPRRVIYPNDPWDIPKPPFRVAHTAAKPGARVDLTMAWGDGEAATPYLARWTRGLGAVTWVAQDLGDPAITARTNVGWSHVWDAVFGWNNQTLPNLRGQGGAGDALYGAADPVDLGGAIDDLMNHGGRGAALLLVAVVFFIVYWLAAGPGTYVFLTTRGRAQMSWFAFGVAALAGTALTVLLVRVLLRGDPAVRHLSVVRWAPGGTPGVVQSNIGLYIPADGYMDVRLPAPAPGAAAYVAPYPIHPAYLKRDELTPPAQDYLVPVPDVAGEPRQYEVRFPYRSTLKRLQAQWVGDVGARVDGKVTAGPGTIAGLTGVLTNSTGVDLRDSYLAFRTPDDVLGMFYVPAWKAGDKLDLVALATPPLIRFVNPTGNDVPGRDKALFGRIGRAGAPLEWDGWLLSRPRYNPLTPADHEFFPLMTFFELLPPMREQQNPGYQPRKELLRRSGRMFDLSAAVIAGSMVVLAEAPADSPLPVALEVEGDETRGTGTTLYQFVLPIDRPAPPPTTAPAPTTQAAANATMNQ